MDQDPIGNELAGNLTSLFYKAAENLGKNRMTDQEDKKPKEPVESQADEDDDDEEEGDIFEVDFLMDTKVKKGVRYFYVRWKGYDESEDSWEPEENLAGAKDILQKFMEQYNGKKKGKLPKSTPPSKSLPRKRGRTTKSEPSDEEEVEEKPSDDEEYGAKGSKRSKNKSDPVPGPSVPAKNVNPITNVVRRRMATNLRWLESDSSSDDEEKSPPELAVPKVVSPPVEPSNNNNTIIVDVPQPATPIMPSVGSQGDQSDSAKQKEKKKKKKVRGPFDLDWFQSKKHKDKDRSRSPSSEPKASASTSNQEAVGTLEKTTLTFLGAFLSDASNEVRFVARNPNDREISLSLHEAFLMDSWNLCRYLTSKVQFSPSGSLKVVLPKMNGS